MYDRLVTIWLCGDDRCKAELVPIHNRHAYRCPKCGEEWDAMRRGEMNLRDEWATE